jgi:hypothetical protein
MSVRARRVAEWHYRAIWIQPSCCVAAAQREAAAILARYGKAAATY